MLSKCISLSRARRQSDDDDRVTTALPAMPEISPPAMAEVRLDTLAGIRAKHGLWCYCMNCKRDARLDLEQLAERIGWSARFNSR